MIINTNNLRRRRTSQLSGMGLTPGYTPAQQAMADAFKKEFGGAPVGGPTSVYDVPGLLLKAPDCTQASGGAFVSSGCVDQALVIQQENFRRTAQYNAGTLQLPSNPIISQPPQPHPPAPPTTSTPTNIKNQVNNQSSSSQSNQMISGSGGIMDNVNVMGTQELGNVSIMGYQVPIWMVGLVAVGLVAVVMGGRH